MDLPVLKYVDVLIGLSLVLVLVSTIVLAITQALLNVTFARARHLQRGLARLIAGVDPASVGTQADYVSRLLVRHPLIGRHTFLTPLRGAWTRVTTGKARRTRAAADGQGTVLPAYSPGSVVQREELAFLLIEFAAGEGPLMDPANQGSPPASIQAAHQAVASALRRTGIEDPAATLRAIRMKAVENERANPTQPAHQWRSDAVADCAASDFIGRLHDSFDSTMARVTDTFGGESQLWVSVVALVVAIALQLDSFTLLKRLSVDDRFRASYVEIAQTLTTEKDAVTGTDRAAEQEKNALDAQIKTARESYALLGSPSISLLPPERRLPNRNQWPGVLLSWLLLSLGAPFWFDQLKNLLKLRSVLAKKDDEQREDRESKKAAKPSAPAPAPSTETVVVEAVGEAGDLAATGALG